MKTADAKAPRFDSAWWAQNKAKAADADKGLEKALAVYGKERTTFQLAAKNGKVTTTEIDKVAKALTAVMAQARTKKADSKLGALQKDTKEALATYEKQCAVALKDLKAIEDLPVLKMNAQQLIQKVPQFEKFCKIEYSSENYNFVNLMMKKPKTERFIYDDFIATSGKSAVNISGETQAKFNKIAKAIKDGQLPDTAETWSKAPWGEAVQTIYKLLDNDTKRRFQIWVIGQASKSTKLP